MQDANHHQTAARLTRIVTPLANAAITLAVIALLGLVVVQGWQVIARYVLNDSPSWTEPVTLLLLSTAMSLGAAAGVHTRRHFSFGLLADALPLAGRHLLQILQSAVVLGLGAMLAYWGAILFLDGIDIPIAGAPMPQSINYLPIALGGLLMAIFALPQLFQTAIPTAAANTETEAD